MNRDAFKALGVRNPVLLAVSPWARLKEMWGIGGVDERQGRWAGFTRRPMVGAMALSVLFHVAVIAEMVVFAGHMPRSHQEILRVSLVEDVPSSAAAGKSGGSGKAATLVREAPGGRNGGSARKEKNRVLSSRSVSAPPRQVAPVEEAVSERPIVTREPVPSSEAAPPAPQAATGDQASALGNVAGTYYGLRGGGIGGGAGQGTGYGTGAGGSGQGRGAGSGAGGSGTGSGQAAYLREHFAYIRDLIMRNLKYPETARKLGWKGAVTVSFVVLENGTAHDIRVIKSSGHDILDKAVIKTIQEIQPFPRPPVKAELTIPIAFRLEAGTG